VKRVHLAINVVADTAGTAFVKGTSVKILLSVLLVNTVLLIRASTDVKILLSVLLVNTVLLILVLLDVKIRQNAPLENIAI
jgi:hypothetical protein